MPILKILGDMFMIFCAGLIRSSILIVPLFGALYILFIIFTDQFLSQHIFLTLTLSTTYGFTCCLLILSKLCQLRRLPRAEHKPMKQLRDSDLYYENESEKEPYFELSWRNMGSTLKNFIFKNPYEFSKFRPAYGMILLVGLISASVFVASMKHYDEEMDDVYCVGLKAFVLMAFLISMVYFLSNSGFYKATKTDDRYNPFDEYVQVPMKFLVTKAVAIFVTGGGAYWFLGLLLISILGLSIVSSNYLYHASKIDDVLQSILPPIYQSKQRFLYTVLIVVILGCVNALIGLMVVAFIEAKSSFLCILEKNWQRNIGAICFLFSDTEFENLQAIKTALDQKRNQPLTEKEVKAIDYISWPIWRTKPPFMLQNFENDAPESESSDSLDPDENDKPDYNQESDNSEKPELKRPAHKDQPRQESAPPEKLREAKKSAPSEKLREAKESAPPEKLREAKESAPPEKLREAKESAPSEQKAFTSEAPKKLKELASSIAIQRKSRFPEPSSSTFASKELRFKED